MVPTVTHFNNGVPVVLGCFQPYLYYACTETAVSQLLVKILLLYSAT